jgi:hypothetical protein
MVVVVVVVVLVLATCMRSYSAMQGRVNMHACIFYEYGISISMMLCININSINIYVIA